MVLLLHLGPVTGNPWVNLGPPAPVPALPVAILTGRYGYPSHHITS